MRSHQVSPRTTNRITVSGKGSSYPQRSRSTSQSVSRSRRFDDDGRSSRPVRSRDVSSRSISDRDRRASSGRTQQPKGTGNARGRGQQQDRISRASQAPQRPQPTGSASDSAIAGIFNILKLLFVGIAKVFALVGQAIARGFLALWNKSKVIGGALVVVVVLLAGFLVDSALTADKIYQGVSVGDVNVAGMTQEEAANAISERYGNKLESTNVYIFTSEEAARDTDIEQVQTQEKALSKAVSPDEALENKVLWVESSNTLGARLPVQELAAEAYEFGRSSGLLDRFSTLMHSHQIAVRLDYNHTMLSKLLSDINTAIGDPVQEYGITVEGGQASLVEGHDGYEIDKDTFQATLTDKLLNTEVDDPRYIPVAEYVSLKVDGESAAKTVEAVNQVLGEGASFDFESTSTEISSDTLGSWIDVEPAERGNSWYLRPFLSEQKALRTLSESLNLAEAGQKQPVSFELTDDGVNVKPSAEITIPDVGSALEGLDQTLFGSYCESGTQRISGDRFSNPIQTKTTSDPIKLQEALAYGVVITFSSFTTQFNSSTSTLNRMYNIQKAADLINQSVVKADGGTWSFNETAGDCNAEAGFKEAGVVSGEEMTQGAGGGVCQVATTVFNSVYEAGLPINERHNHTISSSAYPTGRDAAIAYPTLDLIWENDTPSDILLTTSYDSNSITVDLIGEDPMREVTTDTGDWTDGDPYKVKVEVDETYADFAVVKMTNGSDGKSISVTRTVKDADGNVLEQKTFGSIYSPVNELYKVGPEVDTAEIERKYARQDDSSSSSDSASNSNSSSNSSSNGSQKSSSTGTNST